MKNTCILIFLSSLLIHCRPKQEETSGQFQGKPHVPTSVKQEHEKLLRDIQKTLVFKDSSAAIAEKLHDLIRHHFAEEEDYVLPQLALLPSLTAGEIPSASKEIIELSEKLRSNMSHISAEHQLIMAYVKELKAAAGQERQGEISAFEKELQKHATLEEEVLFPTSLLIGEYLRLRTKKTP